MSDHWERFSLSTTVLSKQPEYFSFSFSPADLSVSTWGDRLDLHRPRPQHTESICIHHNPTKCVMWFYFLLLFTQINFETLSSSRCIIKFCMQAYSIMALGGEVTMPLTTTTMHGLQTGSTTEVSHSSSVWSWNLTPVISENACNTCCLLSLQKQYFSFIFKWFHLIKKDSMGVILPWVEILLPGFNFNILVLPGNYHTYLQL